MSTSSREPLGVIGVGWVGLVTAASFANLGHDVIGLDVNAQRVAALSRGEVSLHEPGLTELVRRNAARLTFTTEIDLLFERARIVFVCVDTPATASGDADLDSVHAVLDALPASAAGAILVMKSTVPSGTGKKLRHALDDRGLVDVAYASNPEFLREGTAVRDFAEPDRVVIGADDPAVAARIAGLYTPIAESIVRTDVTSSEMIKLASNAFLATKISFINEVANVCEIVGATIDDVARGMGMDRRIGASFLRPGIGFGGSCFPKDVSALKQLAGNTGYHFQLLASVIEVNELQKRRVIGKLKGHFDSLRDRRIALLGLAFKPDTNDMREASSVVLAARLLGEGAHVVAFDPAIDDVTRGALPRDVELCDSAEQAATGADAVVIVTEWPEFAAPVLDGRLLARMATPLIVDGRNLLDPAAVRAAGYLYEGIGRPAQD
ncbi:MAG TPA: UDP-glucose/GDP-mannose dehydrogenase family protein [Gaiellales bacterium]